MATALGDCVFCFIGRAPGTALYVARSHVYIYIMLHTFVFVSKLNPQSHACDCPEPDMCYTKSRKYAL